MRRHLHILLAALFLSACAAPAPQPTATPQPAVPTPVPPAALLSQARAALPSGDLDEVERATTALLSVYPQAAEATAARRLLAESRARRGLADPVARSGVLSEAADALVPLVPNDPSALLWLGRALAAAEEPEAPETLLRYAALDTPIAPYARLLAAQALRAAGRHAEAAQQAEAAALPVLPRAERAGALDLAARSYADAGQPAEALRTLRALLDLAVVPSYRAGVLVRAADLAAAQGDAAQAGLWRNEIVSSAPESAAALTAADALAQDPPQGVDRVALARVYAAAERWDAALAQYDAALQAVPDDPELARLRALALRAAGQTDAALDVLTALAASGTPVSRQAALDRAQLIGQEQSTAQAVADYRDYAARWDTDPLAAVALERAAALLDRLGDGAAGDVRRELAERFPDAAQGQTALERLAWASSAAGDQAAARGFWARLAEHSAGTLRARALLGAARAAQALNQPDATALFEQAIAAAPESFAAARATELLGRNAAGSVDPAAPLTAADWQALAAWAGVPAADLAQEPGVIRAGLLTEAGLDAEASGEYAALLDTWRQDAARLLGLARLATERGATAVALEAADALRALIPAERAAPLALQRLRFPAPYLAAVRASGQDPALFYGLLRQESRFTPSAVSVAGALGVGQVMPETGRAIAGGLGVTDFAPGDLLRPVVGIRFGGQYLRDQLRAADGNPLVALAAYNAGPANAARWKGLADPGDPDAFTAAIDFGETRAYVRTVYANAAIYRALYRWTT